MLNAKERHSVRQIRAKPVCDALYGWMVAQRMLVSEGSAIAKAVDCSLKRWEALMRYLDDGQVPIDTTTGSKTRYAHGQFARANWLFAGSLRAGPTRCRRS